MIIYYSTLSVRYNQHSAANAADLRTKILDFGGFDSGISLLLRDGILMSIGSLPESSSQAILAGIISVGRSGMRYLSQPELL